ncbi:MAG: IPT/TIG domain-containing protein [bacterium]
MQKQILKLIFCLLLFLIIPNFTHAASIPVLNFSDIDSGPKTGNTDGVGSGAIVTIWGNYLGSTQGTSKVYVGNVEATAIYYWKNADGQLPSGPADLYSSHKMQEIAFAIPATAPDGLTTIKVVVNGIETNTLPFTIRAGNIYFIKNGGNDTTGNGSWGNAWATLGNVVSGNGKIAAGDVIYSVGIGANSSILVGVTNDLIGTASSPFSLLVYPNTIAQVTTTSGNTAFKNYNHGPTIHPSAYWNFSKFSIDTGYEAFSIFGYGRYVANNVKGVMPAVSYSGFIGGSCPPSNVPDTVSCSGHKVFGNEVHDYGDPTGVNNFHHLIYISNRSGATAEAYEIGWNNFHDNTAYQGIHVYDYVDNPWAGTFKIHNNLIKNQAGNAINMNDASLADYQIYNNVIVLDTTFNPANAGGFASPAAAIRIDTGSANATFKLYNNTVFGYAATNNMGTSTIDYQNNLMVDNRNVAYAGAVNANFTKANNLFYSLANPSLSLPSWATGSSNSNPFFSNAANYDFSLQVGSSAKAAGTDATLATAPTDFYGQPRVAGSVSIGAIQYVNNDKLLQQSDLEYLGAFRVPKGKYGASTGSASLSYGGGPIAYNKMNDSLFMYGQGKLLLEISIPQILNSTNMNALNTSNVLQPSVDIADGNWNNVGTAFAPIGNGAIPRGLLSWNGKLLGSTSGVYDADNQQVYSHFLANNNWSTDTGFSGFYKLTNEPIASIINRAGFLAGFMGDIPASWQGALGGTVLTGEKTLSIIGRSSFGPAAFVFNPADMGVIDPIQASGLMYYPATHPTLGQYTTDSINPVFNRATQISGLVFPEGSSSVLFFGSTGLGSSCYGEGTSTLALDNTFANETVTNSVSSLTLDTTSKTIQIPSGLSTAVGAYIMLKPTANLTYHIYGTITAYNGTTLSLDVITGGIMGSGSYSDWEVHLATSSGLNSVRYCYDPTSTNKGDHAYPYAYYVWAYDANDFLKVKNGTINLSTGQAYKPWEILPYGTWQLDFPFAIEYKDILGAAYDSSTQRLFLSEKYGDHPNGSEPFPLVQVYHLNLNPVIGDIISPSAPANLSVQ